MKKIIFNQTPPNSGVFFPPLWKKVGGGVNWRKYCL